MSGESKFRAWNGVVRRFQHFNLMDIEKQKGKIQWHILDIDQFAGIRDENGADIYENDVCVVDGIGYCVVEISPWYGVQFNDRNGQHIPVIDCVAENDTYEVVGNIHKNPDLIK